jgi:hypothetical protein
MARSPEDIPDSMYLAGEIAAVIPADADLPGIKLHGGLHDSRDVLNPIYNRSCWKKIQKDFIYVLCKGV